MIKTYASVEASTADFKQLDISTVGSNIKFLPKKSEFDCVTVRIKVTRAQKLWDVARRKKEVEIADSTGIANLGRGHRFVKDLQLLPIESCSCPLLLWQKASLLSCKWDRHWGSNGRDI